MIYLNLDENGYLLSVCRMDEPPEDMPCVESLDGLDLSGCRIRAHRWDGERLTLDEARLHELKAAAAAEKAAAEQAQAEAEAIREVQAALVTAQINTLTVDDATALRWRLLYPKWMTGKLYRVGDKVQYADKLYRCLQTHESQADWTPDVAASLWTEICEAHAGTVDDPIPYDGNMALESGKYYSQDGVTYRCFRDTGNPVYHPLPQLLGLYVETAD